MRSLLLLTLLSAVIHAEDSYQPFDPKSPQYRAAAAFSSSDLVFPHLAIGGGWDTTLTIVNMGTREVQFAQSFFDQTGSEMQVSYRTIPTNNLVTGTGAGATIGPGRSLSIQLLDAGPLRVGWSRIYYQSEVDRLGGYAIFRQTVPGRPSFEALVPLSSINDYKFYLPFDNRQGFETTMAVLNPWDTPTTVNMTFRASNGDLLANYTIQLLAGQQVAFPIQAIAPGIFGRVGVIYVTGTSPHLSSLGFRFNGEGAFATIPIMNWPGMFP